ncbi:MAG: tryptophan-rich sensory protein [Clostridiales bacterium]|nr:tryptophan-rich sensory protein [Clostridiales bacterium]
MNTRMKAILNVLFFLATVAVNALGATGGINGLSQKVVSDRYDTLITPAPFAFSIWGVLYVLLLATLLFLLIRHKTESVGRVVDQISPLFWVSSVMNIAWIVAFSYEQIGLSTVLILGLAVSLALINLRLKSASGMAARLGGLTFGLYNGWLLIATFVNVAAWLVKAGWDGFGLAPATWTLIILVLALVGTLVIQFSLRNAALTLPIAWAYYGIFSRHSATGFWQGQYPQVSTTALIGVVAAVAITVGIFLWNQRCVLPLTEGQRNG